MFKRNFSQPIDYDYLHVIRQYEILYISRVLPLGETKNLSILNFGAGDGYQSRLLEELGYSVTSLDLATSRHASHSNNNIVEYDGLNIPFADSSFDFIFSSNVLEHVSPSLYSHIFSELSRVSKSDALHIHILPTPRWRLYTSLTYYTALTRSLILYFVFHVSRICKKPFLDQSNNIDDDTHRSSLISG